METIVIYILLWPKMQWWNLHVFGGCLKINKSRISGMGARYS